MRKKQQQTKRHSTQNKELKGDPGLKGLTRIALMTLLLIHSCSFYFYLTSPLSLQYGVSSDHLNNRCSAQWALSSSTNQLICTFWTGAHMPASVLWFPEGERAAAKQHWVITKTNEIVPQTEILQVTISSVSFFFFSKYKTSDFFRKWTGTDWWRMAGKKKAYLYNRESIWLSQQTQQVPFLTLPHWDPSSEVSATPARNMLVINTITSLPEKNTSNLTIMLFTSKKSTILGTNEQF